MTVTSRIDRCFRGLKAAGRSGLVTFITAGVESAVTQAKAAAVDKDVQVIGGASTFQQCLNAGLADELWIDIMPVLLGDGLRLFEHIGDNAIKLK